MLYKNDIQNSKRENMSEIPESIGYLKEAIDFFNSLAPEELNEDTDTELLESLLRKRIAGCTIREGQDLLDSDRETIENLPEDVKEGNPALLFILGYLFLPDIARLILNEDSESEVTFPQVMMELPKGMKANRGQGFFNITSGPLLIIISALEQSTYDILNKQWDGTITDPQIQAECKIESVSIGKAKGRKRVYIQSKPVYWKRIDYLLAVSGGFVVVTLDAGGKDFDESVIEPFLHTIKVKS